MMCPLPIEWNSTSAVDPATFSATIGYMQNQPRFGAESLGAAPQMPAAREGSSLRERAARSRNRNWEALEELANY